MREVVFDHKLRDRINKGYKAMNRAKELGRFEKAEEYKGHLFKLEIEHFEKALGIKASIKDLNFYQILVETRLVFPDSKLVSVKIKKTTKKRIKSSTFFRKFVQ